MTISRPARETAPEVFGPYRVLRPLGRGGMGEVHEAYDTVRERHVALKRILAGNVDEELRARFRRESRIAARLDSPHVVPIHDFGVIDERLYIDMRLVRGSDLGRAIRDGGPLAPVRASSILGQLASALDAAHEAGLVHRDVKPSNALLTTHRGQDFVYLADFGIVHVALGTGGTRLTGTGTALGTVPYMAPEQIRAVDIDHRVDVYALGCVLFEMLTGRPPFLGEQVTVAHDHVYTRPPRPSDLRPDLPAELDAVVLRALEKLPQRRWSSAGDLADATRHALPASARPQPRPAPQPPRRTTPPLTHGSAPPAPRPGPRTPTPPPAPVEPTRPMNRLAVPAVVLGVLLPVLGIAAGLVSVRQIRRTGERGRDLARCGIALGAVGTVVLAIVAGWLLLHTPTVSRETLRAQIVAQSGLAPAQVSCPTPLPARIGASVTCTASAGGRTQLLRVTTTALDGPEVNFDITTTQ